MSAQEHHHAIPFKFLIRTFLTLLVLTVITVGAALIDFSHFNPYVGGLIDFTPMNIILAMLIAVIKASLVATFFMGLKLDTKLNVGIFISNIVFLFIFFTLTLTDTLLRDVPDPMEGKKMDFVSPVDKANENPNGGAHH